MVDEPDEMVDVCVLIGNITGTVETPFEVNITLADDTAGTDGVCLCTRVALSSACSGMGRRQA